MIRMDVYYHTLASQIVHVFITHTKGVFESLLSTQNPDDITLKDFMQICSASFLQVFAYILNLLVNV